MLAIAFHWILKLVFVALLLKVGKSKNTKMHSTAQKLSTRVAILPLPLIGFVKSAKKNKL